MADAGVVHHHVDTAEPVGSRRSVFDVFSARYVALDERRIGTGPLVDYLVGRLFVQAGGLPDVGDDHVRTILDEFQSDAASVSACPAANNPPCRSEDRSCWDRFYFDSEMFGGWHRGPVDLF